MRETLIMKENEARILVYLSQTKPNMNYAGKIAAKLDIDYAYTLQLLHRLKERKWLTMKCYAVKQYYFLTETGKTKLPIARSVLK